MNFLHLNKYIIKEIFSYLEDTTKLKIIKYSKKLMEKIDISKFTYQKTVFDSYITPTTLEHTSLLYEMEIFDKKTTQKLISEWEKETTGIFEDKDIFYFHQNNLPKNINILEINKNNEKDLKFNFPNIIILNIYDLKDIEIPCSILYNLESISLHNVQNIKLLSEKTYITLDKLKHLYMDDISFKNNENLNLKIVFNNLEYLDLRVKEVDGGDDDDDDEEELENSEDINKKGFIKKNVFNYLIQVFNFHFLSEFLIEKKEDEDEDILIEELYDEYKSLFKKPNILFKAKNIGKLNYFNFEIYYELDIASGAYELNQIFNYTYLFSKTKGNKYLFKTIYEYKGDGDDCCFKLIEKQNRYSNEISFDNFYFFNKELLLGGNGFYFLKEDININVHSFKIDFEDKYEVTSECLKFLDDLDENTLESIYINILDIKEYPDFIKNIKKFNGLRVFIISDDCLLNNHQIMELITNLSYLKVIVIEIRFKRKLNLSKKQKKRISDLFPKISIQISEKSSLIKI